MSGDPIHTQDGVALFAQASGLPGAEPVILLNHLYLNQDFLWLAEHHYLVSFDTRNRGRSETVSDTAKLQRGIEHDVEDIEAVREQFGLESFSLIGYSYQGLVAALYAMRNPKRVRRLILLGPQQPRAGEKYPAEFTYTDEVTDSVWKELQGLQSRRAEFAPVDFCRTWWHVMQRLYVADPAQVSRIANWGFCDLPNERNLMSHWMTHLGPSIAALQLTAEDFARASMPTLVIHGRKDRNVPYGAGREWASLLPNARLLTIENAAHAAWIDEQSQVFAAVKEFVDGHWPAGADLIASSVTCP